MNSGSEKWYICTKPKHVLTEFYYVIRNYTTTLLFFLFHISTIFSSSNSHSFSGDSIAISIRYDRLDSPIRFRNRVFIIFIPEKLHSTDAVPTGIDR